MSVAAEALALSAVFELPWEEALIGHLPPGRPAQALVGMLALLPNPRRLARHGGLRQCGYIQRVFAPGAFRQWYFFGEMVVTAAILALISQGAMAQLEDRRHISMLPRAMEVSAVVIASMFWPLPRLRGQVLRGC